MARFQFFVVAAALLCSCGPSSSHNSINRQEVINGVNEMFDGYFNDIKAHGLTAEFKYLDNSSDFFWVPPGYTSALDYDSVKTILEQNAGAFRSVDYSWETVRIYPLTNETATYTGIVRGVMIDTAGNKQTVALIESGTLIKRADGWKYLCGQTAVLPDQSDNPQQH